VAEAQATVNTEHALYQSDLAWAQGKANECSSAQNTVQQDQTDGSPDLSSDEETEQSDCSQAQSAAEVVQSDSTQLSTDEANLQQAKSYLAEAEGGT
jgi:hypothetical protein